jgi:hypothetical protein
VKEYAPQNQFPAMSVNYKKRKRMIIVQETAQSGTFISKGSESNSVTQTTVSPEPADPKAIAEYSAEILTELRDLANGAGHTFLAYLIQVAVEEAKIQASGGEQR